MLEEAARIDPSIPVRRLSGVPEGTLADPRPPLGSETWERHSGGSPKEEFARKATREGFEEAAEIGSRLTTKGASKALLKCMGTLVGPLGFAADVMSPSPLEASTAYGSEFETTEDAREREKAAIRSEEFLAQPPPWADPHWPGGWGADEETLTGGMPQRRIQKEEWK